MAKLLPGFFCFVFMLHVSALFAHNDGEHEGGGRYSFIENRGQFHSNVLYKTDIGSGSLFLEKDAFTYHLYDAGLRAELHTRGHEMDTSNITFNYHAFQMKFKDADAARVDGSDREQHYYNFYTGNKKENWASNVPGFKEVSFRQLYEGIDIRMYSDEGGLKYDFIVAPGSDPEKIKWTYEGIDDPDVNERRITLNTSVGEMNEELPYAYQVIDGKEVEVGFSFTEYADGTIGFEPGADYNPEYAVIIDPTLIFSSYTGSSANNFGYTASFDSEGFLYSGGTAFGMGYPTTMGAYSTSFSGGASGGIGGTDIVLTKWDTTGTSLSWSTYLGGSSDEMPHSLVVNEQSELYMLGTTSSLDYPTTAGAHAETFISDTASPNPIDMQAGLGVSYNNGSDLVVTRLNDDGTALVASTYLGGSHNDGINLTSLRYNYGDEVRGEVYIDRDGDIVVASCTQSGDIPGTSNGFLSTKSSTGANIDGVIMKLDPQLANILAATYLGGLNDDAVYSVTADDSNDYYVSGGTSSNNFPTSSGSLNPTYNGDIDAFVTHLSSDMSTMIAGTFRGTGEYDQAYFVERDNNGDVYIFGQTEALSNDMIFNAAYNDPDGGQFITKFNPGLNSLVWSTRFGTGDNTPDISPTAFMVDLCNAVYLSGWGSPIQGGSLSTTGLDLAGNPFQSTTDGADFYLMQLADDASTLQYASFMGGSATEHVDGGTSRFDKKGKIYQAVCAGCPAPGQGSTSDFPTHPFNAHSSSNNAVGGCNKAVFKIDFLLPTIVSDFLLPDKVCAGDTVQMNNVSLEQNATQHWWDFGDGNTSTDFEPEHVYQNGGTYTVQLALTDSVSCNLADTLTKTIEVQDDTTYNFPDISKCRYDTVEIGFINSNEPAGATFNWSPSSTLISPGLPVPQSVTSGDTTYTLIVEDDVCTDTGFQKVLVDSVTALAPADTSVCSEELPLSFTGDGQGTGSTFNWAAGKAFNDTLNSPLTDSSFTANPDSSEHFFFTAINATGCTETDTMTLSLVDIDDPLIASFEQPDTGCVPYQILFQNTSDSLGNTTFGWDFGNGDSSVQYEPAYTYNSSGVYTITLTAADSATCMQEDTFSLSVTVRTDTAYHFADVTKCTYDTVDIGFTAINEPDSASYNWTSSSTLVDSNSAVPQTFINQDTSYVVIIDDGVCVDTGFQTVKVDTAYAQAPPDTTVCFESLPLSFTGSSQGSASSYVWTGEQALSDTLNNPLTDSSFTADSAETRKYYFSAVTSAGCVETDSMILDVVTIDDPLTASFVQPDTGCLPYEVHFNNTTDSLNNTHFQWAFGTGDSSAASNPVFTYDSGGFFTVTLIAVDTGICLQQDTLTQSFPVRADSVYNLDFRTCLNDTLPIGTEGDGQSTYSWLQAGAVSDPSLPDPLHEGKQDTTLTLVASGICVDTFYNHITVDSIFAQTDSFKLLCSDEQPFTLTGSGLGFANEYIWSVSADFSDSLNADPSDSTFTRSQEQGLVRYHFKSVSPEGCTDTASTLVAISDLLIQTSPDTGICMGDTTVLTAENLYAENTVDYSWEPAEDILSRPDSTSVIVSPQINTQYRLITVNDSGCIGRDTVNTFVSRLNPDHVAASSSADTIVRTESVTLFGNPDTGDVMYSWLPEEKVDYPADAETQATPENTTTYELTVTDRNNEDCRYRDTTVVTVTDLICEPPVVYIPNAFTPDGDGLNEQFHVRGTHIREIDLKIYNRWGEKVFETTDPEQGWNGMYRDQQAESGVYVYHVKVICTDGQRYFEKGNLTLLK